MTDKIKEIAERMMLCLETFNGNKFEDDVPENVKSDVEFIRCDYRKKDNSSFVEARRRAIKKYIEKMFTEYESPEIARLRGIIETLEKQLREVEYAEYEPYMGWCDVDGCNQESSSNGGNWSETGYWCLCPKHSKLARDGGEQPKMKQSAINRENKRDKTTGILTISEAEEQ